MPATYEPIATTTLGTDAQIEFTSIPTTYTDLVLVMNFGLAQANDPMLFRVGNGSIDTGSNYSMTILYGTGSAAGSYRESNVVNGAAGLYYLGAGTAIEHTTIISFMNYSNTTTNKTIIERSGGAAKGAETAITLWRNTAAINIIRIGAASGMVRNIKAGTVATLYGIKAA